MAVIPGDPAVKDPTKASYAAAVNDALADLNSRLSASETAVLPNGSFEFDLDVDGEPDLWTVTDADGGTHALSDLNDSGGNARHGAKSLQVITTATGGRATALSDNFIPVGEDNVIELDGFVQRDTASIRIRVEIKYYDEAESLVATDTLVDITDASTAWLYQIEPSTVPSGAYFFKVNLIGGESGGGTIAGNVFFDGFNAKTFVITDAAVAQAQLKTATQDVSTATGGVTLNFTAAGEYGFFPTIKHSAGGADGVQLFNAPAVNLTTSFTTSIELSRITGGTATARMRYVTASGDVFWIWILRDKVTKEILIVDTAPDHPAMSSGDPVKTPHPFQPSYDEALHEIICITSPRVKGKYGKWINNIRKEAAVTGKGVSEVVYDDYDVDEDSAPIWPDGDVTVGYETDEDIMDLYFSGRGQKVKLKKVKIPQPSYVIHKSLIKKVA